MALNKEQMREYMRKRRAEKREKNSSGLEVISSTVTDLGGASGKTVCSSPADRSGDQAKDVRIVPSRYVYDKKKYPNRGAWEIAVGRVERAVRYAQMFPNLIGSDDRKFQTLDWQYRNEGLKVVSRI